MTGCQSCKIFNNQPIKNLRKGESLFLQGNDVKETYLLNNGVIKIIKVTESGNEYILELKVSGDKVALINLFEKHKLYNVSAIALTDCEIVVVSKEHFDITSKDTKECIMATCLSSISKRSSFRDSILYEDNVENKIIILLDYLYDYFGNISEEGYKVIKLPFNRSELAGLINVRRETFSRKLSSLSRDNLIEVDKQKIILKT